MHRINRLNRSTRRGRFAALLALPLAWALFVTPGRASHPEIEDSVLQCAVDGSSVKLSWNIAFFAPIAGWVIERDGEPIAELDPSASGYVDVDVPAGEHVYVLSAISLSSNGAGVISPLGRCSVVVGDFGLRCRAEGRQVHLAWGPILIDVAIEAFIIRRDGVPIARVPESQLSYVDTVPAPGTYRYTVHAEMFPDHGFLVGACTVRVPNDDGFVCEVVPPNVILDWSRVVLPAVVIDRFVVVRDGERIAATRETRYVDAPPPGEHDYVVLAIVGPISEDDIIAAVAANRLDDATIAASSFVVGRCTIFMPGGDVPPPEELTCVDLDAPADKVRGVLDALAADGLELRAHDVLLVWQKPIEYDVVVISRNDEVIARIEGSRFWYVDRDVPAGHHVYGVVGIVGNRSSEPATCEIDIPRPPLPPPRDLRCEFIGVDEPVAGGVASTGFVQLRWVNGAAYEWIVISRNDGRIARIPGNATSYRDLAPRPGLSVYRVFGVIGLRRSEAAECEVAVPPGRVPPPEGLRCAVIQPVPQPLPGVPIDPALPVDLAEADDGVFAPPGVFLRWENPVEYERVVIKRNGIVIATLPGSSESYFDRFVNTVASGVLRYEVSGVIGNRASEPAVCEVEIEPQVPPPPREFTCEVDGRIFDPNGVAIDPADPGTPDVAPVTVVTLRWVNPVRYAALVLSRDGEVIARLSGDAMGYRDIAPPGGEHVYGLHGISPAGVPSRVVECKVEVPPVPVPPVRGLTCVAVDTSAQGPTAHLEWVNAARYDMIIIVRNDEELDSIPGDSTHYNDLGLEPGVYEYQVIAVLGNRRSRPAECKVVVDGPGPRNLLYFSSGLFVPAPDDSAAAIALSGSGRITSLMSNHDPVQGWSFGVCSDPAMLTVEDATIEDTDTAKLNDGAGPSFLVIGTLENGVTMAVVIDEMDTTVTLPPDTRHSILALTYSAGPDAEPGQAHRVAYCGTLGEPPVAVLYVVEGFGVVPDTRPGLVTLPEPIRPGFLRADANGDEQVDISDAMFGLGFLFLSGRRPRCLDAADANGDADLNVADPIYTLQFKFNDGRPPPPPFPACAPAEFRLGCEDPTCP